MIDKAGAAWAADHDLRFVMIKSALPVAFQKFTAAADRRVNQMD